MLTILHWIVPFGEPSKGFEEVMCDALMEEFDVWGIVSFREPIVDFETMTSSYLQMVGLAELQME